MNEFFDIPGLIHQVNRLNKRTWNEFTKSACKKRQLINKTGAPSVYGELVIASTTTDKAFGQAPADALDVIGAVYEAGVADGSPCWIVIGGSAEVLLETGSAAVHGYWARSSIGEAGRADCQNVLPPGHGIVNADIHFHEIGHCLQSGGAGTLVEINMHEN